MPVCTNLCCWLLLDIALAILGGAECRIIQYRVWLAGFRGWMWTVTQASKPKFLISVFKLHCLCAELFLCSFLSSSRPLQRLFNSRILWSRGKWDRDVCDRLVYSYTEHKGGGGQAVSVASEYLENEHAGAISKGSGCCRLIPLLISRKLVSCFWPKVCAVKSCFQHCYSRGPAWTRAVTQRLPVGRYCWFLGSIWYLNTWVWGE